MDTSSILTSFRAGSVMELGMKPGFDLRRYVAMGLAAITHQGWVLWVNGHSEVAVFPPAWFALGVNARRMVFAEGVSSLQVLKPVFVQPLFKVIVLDGPFRLLASDWAFLAGQSRHNGLSVVVIRPYWLSNRNGNIWATVRANVQADRRVANEGRAGAQAVVEVVKWGGACRAAS